MVRPWSFSSRMCTVHQVTARKCIELKGSALLFKVSGSPCLLQQDGLHARV